MIAVAVAFALLLVPGQSWGPGTHIYLSSLLLKRMERRLPREQARLIEEHRDNFLYGCIAADIINFKSYGGLKNNCHNWTIKERIEELSSSEHERAFLCGYLCHLAADVIAHNHFVPFQLVYGLPPKILGHTYWEARADGQVAEEYWRIIDGLRSHPTLRSNDQIIHRAVPRKALSIGSNKWIFNNILLARSKTSWRGIMDQMRARKPRGELHKRFLTECHKAALENMYRVFKEEGLERLRELDPNGRASLYEARRLRRELIERYGTRIAGAEAARGLAKRKYRLEA
ncbi:MAG: zinc dependent phospholipase C family protein [Planctomycetota bacterium]